MGSFLGNLGKSLLMGAADSFTGGLVSSLFGGMNMDASAHYQRVNMRESAKLQHDENVYWANYNSPLNQMARLRAAGLNPNLVYGNGADAQFVGSVSPSGSAPGPGNSPISLAQRYSTMLQAENIKAQNDLLKSQTMETEEKVRHQRLENERLEASNPSRMGELDYNLLKSENDYRVSQSALNTAQTSLTTLNNSITRAYGFDEARLRVASQDIANQINELNRDAFLPRLQKEFKMSDAQAASYMASAAAARASITKIKAEVDFFNEQRRLAIASGNKIKVESFNEKLRSLGILYDNIHKSLSNQALRMTNNYIDAEHLTNLSLQPVNLFKSIFTPSRIGTLFP